jgi:hypothetical protein
LRLVPDFIAPPLTQLSANMPGRIQAKWPPAHRSSLD